MGLSSESSLVLLVAGRSVNAGLLCSRRNSIRIPGWVMLLLITLSARWLKGTSATDQYWIKKICPAVFAACHLWSVGCEVSKLGTAAARIASVRLGSNPAGDLPEDVAICGGGYAPIQCSWDLSAHESEGI